QLADILNHDGGQNDLGRLHLHHAPAGDVHGQGGDMIEVRVRHQPSRRAHEVPRVSAEVETDLQLRNAPVRLDGGARVTLDGQPAVLAAQVRGVTYHASPPNHDIIRRTTPPMKGSVLQRQP